MPAKTLTISVNEEDIAYLEKDVLLSPSRIFRTAMVQIRESREGLREQIRQFQKKCKILQEKVFELQENENKS